MEAPSNLPGTEIQNFLIRRLGEKEAAEIMEYINTEIDQKVAEKVDASKKEIALWRDEMKNVFGTKEDAVKLEKKLVKRVSRAEGTLILWSFVFWLTLIIAMVIIFKLMK
ncbi:MAG: hypothetical protein ABI863_03800 [Ginsengibacter sp.]